MWAFATSNWVPGHHPGNQENGLCIRKPPRILLVYDQQRVFAAHGDAVEGGWENSTDLRLNVAS